MSNRSTIVWRVDYVGIAVLIVASFFPVVYYSFLCVPFVRHLYLATMTTLGFLTLGVTLSEKFQDSRYSPLRALLFSSLGTGFFFFPFTSTGYSGDCY